MARILEAVAAEFVVPVPTLKGRSRCAMFVRPRQAFCWLAARGHWSYPQIGRFLNRDHTTVLHGVYAAECWMDKDETYALKVDRLRDLLKLHHRHLTKKTCPNCGHKVN